MKLHSKVLILLGALSLSGCLSPVKTDPVNTYEITTVPSHIPVSRMRSTTLLVTQPDTSPAYNTANMAYSMRPYQLSYFSQNRWSETPSQMLLPLIVQTLQNTHYFHAVVTPPFSGRYSYVLSTQITKLQLDYTHRPALLRLAINAQITSTMSNQIIAAKQFSVTEPIRQGTPYSGVFAANKATAKLLTQLTEFSLKNTGRQN